MSPNQPLTPRYLLHQNELLAMPRGTRVSPREHFADEGYVLRSDLRSGLRRRLERLSERGEFRMVGPDEWERA